MSIAGQLPVVIIACQVFQDLLEKYLPQDLAEQITFLDYGLHSVPKKLASEVQERIDQIEEPSLVVLGYGLCGNGLNQIKAGIHTLLIPKADDCIAIFLGSREAYKREFQAVPGTYYLTKGWLESGSNPLQEYQGYAEKYSQEQAIWFMDVQYKNYERLVMVAHSREDLDEYRQKALEVAEFCQRWEMRYEEIEGSDKYLLRLVETLTDHADPSDDFILVPPGGELRQSQFIE